MRALLIKKGVVGVMNVSQLTIRTMINGPCQSIAYVRTPDGMTEILVHNDFQILGQDDPEAWNVLIGEPIIPKDTPVAGNVLIVGIATSGLRGLTDAELKLFKIGDGGAVITMSKLRRSIGIHRLEYIGENL